MLDICDVLKNLELFIWENDIIWELWVMFVLEKWLVF